MHPFALELEGTGCASSHKSLIHEGLDPTVRCSDREQGRCLEFLSDSELSRCTNDFTVD